MMTLLLGLVVWGSATRASAGSLDDDLAKPVTRPDPVAAATADPIDELAPVAVPEPSEKALRYYHTGMIIWGFNELWGLFLPALIAFGGFSARLRSLALRTVRGFFALIGLPIKTSPDEAGPVGDGCDGSARLWFFTVGLYIVGYLTILFVIHLPISYYLGFVRQHAYGLSNQSHSKWLSDTLLAFGVELVAAFLLTWIPYLLIRKSPRRWWLYTGLLSIPFLFATVLIKPVWIDPLFNDFAAMKDKHLEKAILDLAARAGIEGSRVYEVNKSVDTKAVNAYVTGIQETKRIVLWDTLIARLNERELLFVMGHEMGHYVLGHVVRSILLSSIVTLTGLYFVHRAGNWLISRYSARLGFRSLADVASVPLLLLLLQITGTVLGPVAYAYSRYQEHEADRFALDLTRTNHSGATAFVKLQTENLGNPRPGIIYRIFRASHPSIGDRIDFCNTYRPEGQTPAASSLEPRNVEIQGR